MACLRCFWARACFWKSVDLHVSLLRFAEFETYYERASEVCRYVLKRCTAYET